MGLAGRHDMGTEFVRQVLSESEKVWLAHTKARGGLIKAHGGHCGVGVVGNTTAPTGARQGVPRAALKLAHRVWGRLQPRHKLRNTQTHGTCSDTEHSRFALPVCETIPAIVIW